MNITILTDNPNSWVIPFVEILKKQLEAKHIVKHIYFHEDISPADVMFILGCEKIIPSKYLSFHKNNIVIHPSKLPDGKGWSPLAWQILENKNKIPVSLFEAIDRVDAGDVYLVDYIELDGGELNDAIKNKQGEIIVKMINQFIDIYPTIDGTPQKGKQSFYKKRKAKDSELDINKTIKEQFNLLRIVDNERYPAFFYLGKKYIIKIYEDD